MNRHWGIFSKLRYLLAAHRSRREFDDEINAHIGMLYDFNYTLPFVKVMGY